MGLKIEISFSIMQVYIPISITFKLLTQSPSCKIKQPKYILYVFFADALSVIYVDLVYTWIISGIVNIYFTFLLGKFFNKETVIEGPPSGINNE